MNDGKTAMTAIQPIYIPTLCEQSGITDMRSIQPQYSEATKRWLAGDIDERTMNAHTRAKNVLPEYEYLYR
jgi:hypothetical protein